MGVLCYRYRRHVKNNLGDKARRPQYIDVLLAQGKTLAPTTVQAPFEFVWP